MRKHQTCSKCGENSPETETNYTLIGYGWRLERSRRPHGDFLAEWRCPACWRAYRESGAPAIGTSRRDATKAPAKLRRVFC
jgi:hypothetical protein